MYEGVPDAEEVEEGLGWRFREEMLDVGFDFTSDLPGYWDKFLENNDRLGGGGSD